MVYYLILKNIDLGEYGKGLFHMQAEFADLSRPGCPSLRGGEVIGDAKVMFAGDYEVLELSHRALNREIFASGALKAALWIVNQKPGGYTMRDVLETGR